MGKFNLSKLDTILNIEYIHAENIWLTSGYTLRRLVGVLGMALPPLLYFFLYVASGHSTPLDSISHYYYTRVSGIFIIILGTLALFLLVYKGKKSIDFYISLFAGIFALCLLLFPTCNIASECGDTSKPYAVTILDVSEIRDHFHYFSAAIFLVCLAVMSLFLFTQSNKEPKERGKRKIIRNRVYRVCGIIMILALIVIALEAVKIIPADFYLKYHLTFWMETIAIESFGFSWLVKGNTLFKDRTD